MNVLCRLLALLLAGAASVAGADSQRIGSVDTSQWRGFNLLEKFTLRGNAPYREDDFRWIAEFGFNFVRLPIDYRCYTDRDDWLKFNERALQEIDAAVAFGQRHRVHVCLNLHRAPGYCVNPPAEPRNLWTDPVAQEAFIAHWVMFARRYRKIPTEDLSFNLLNEPGGNTRETFLAVNEAAIAAIQREDPRRLIVVDGNHTGRDPARELIRHANVIQATRGYHPASISHYQASWIKGSERWPVPTWPLTKLTGHLYGPAKPELRSPLVLRGEFPAGTEIALAIGELSNRARLQSRADGRVIAAVLYDPKADPAAWKEKPSGHTWVYHEPAAALAFQIHLSAPTREITVENVEGDWIRFSTLAFQAGGGPRQIWSADPTWGVRQEAHSVASTGELLPPPDAVPAQPLIDFLRPWREIAAEGETVFVGEWGCFNRTPHRVALAWMEAWLVQWRQARFGWALWNFRGSFGILDSGRTDVTYEDWHGHKLDRAMLRLLQADAARSP